MMAYFEENEQILYLSNDFIEKQMLEDGLNRKLTPVQTVGALVEEIEGTIARQGRVTVIVTQSMSDNFKPLLDNVVEALGTLDSNTIQVFEVGIGALFKGALTFVDVTTFIEFARRERRVERIGKLEEDGDEDSKKESQLMRELIIEVDSAKEKIEIYEQLIGEREEEITQLTAETQAMTTTVDNVYKVQISNLETALEQVRDELEELKRLFYVEKEKVRDYERDVSKYRGENKGLELEKKSLQALNEDRKQAVRRIEGENRIQKQENEKLQQEKIDILRSRVDAEEHVMLSMELDKERDKYLSIIQEFEMLKVEAKKKDFIIADLKIDVQDLRSGEQDVMESGRTSKLDTHTFTTVNLFYVKVITELPYLMSPLKAFYKLIKEQYGGRTHVMILRNDEGLDSKHYQGVQLYGTLGDVKEEDEVFLLHPTRRMFTGAEKFDKSVQTLLVLDYIRSTDYYLNTEAMGKNITVVQDSGMIRKYGLKGTPISLDSGTLLDINYDDKIEKARMERLRESMVRGKVESWMRRLGVTGE